MIKHTVQKGDTMWKIAQMHHVPLENLIAANPNITSPNMIDVGMKINVPEPKDIAAEPEESVGTGLSGQLPAVPSPVPQNTSPASGIGEMLKYVVKNGDSMWNIAKQNGVNFEDLKTANPQITNPNDLQPGQMLNLPLPGLKATGMAPIPLSKKQIKEHLTAPITSIPSPPVEVPKPEMPTKFPKMEVPQMETKPIKKMEIPMEVPKMEMPKMEMPKMPMQMQMPKISSTTVSPVNISDDDTEIIQQLYYAPHYHMGPPMPAHKKPPRVQCYTIFPGFVPCPPGMMPVYQGPIGGPGYGYGYPTGGGYAPMGGGYAPMGGGYAPMGGGYAPTGGGYAPTGGGYAPTGGGYAPTGGGYAPMGGGYAPMGGGYAPTGYPTGSPYMGYPQMKPSIGMKAGMRDEKEQ